MHAIMPYRSDVPLLDWDSAVNQVICVSWFNMTDEMFELHKSLISRDSLTFMSFSLWRKSERA
jgi:hypothetical protein